MVKKYNYNNQESNSYTLSEIIALEGLIFLTQGTPSPLIYHYLPEKDHFKIRIPSIKIRKDNFKIRIPRPEEEIKFTSIDSETPVKKKIKKRSRLFYCDNKECLKSYKSENGLKYHKRTKHN